MARSLVGVVGSSLIGSDPFNRRCWSGCSYYFFKGLQDRGRLHRAFGVEASRWERIGLIAKNFRVDRASWRLQFHLDRTYREILTSQIREKVEQEDLQHDFVQIGALYNVPSILQGRSRCVSFHDGNLAESLRSPNTPSGVSSAKLDAALQYEREVYQGIDLIFAMSEYLRTSFINDFDVPPNRVFSIGGGVNLDALPEPPIGKRYDTADILFIGIEFDRKGGWDVLNAFKQVHSKIPRSRLNIVGPPRLAIPHDLESGVIYHGHLNKQDPEQFATLRSLFAKATVFVMPSRYEPFGVAPLEAMAHEIPCIVTNRWALAEMVRPGVDGDHVACENVEQLAETMVRLLEDPVALERMGKSGRLRVLDYYTWDKVVERFLDILDRSAVAPVEGTRIRPD